MLSKLREQLEEIRNQKHAHFDDFQPLIKKIASTYGSLFPKFTENNKGSHYVYNFGIPEFFPFTVVKEHGSRECQSPKAAKRIINAIDDILDYVEVHVPDGEESASEGDSDDK